MHIQDVHIIYYIIVGIIGLFVGQLVSWCNQRLPGYKKIFSKEFFGYFKKTKLNYLLMAINSAIYLGLLYRFGLTLNFFKYAVLVPMLLSAFCIDYKLQIIPNRLTLTIFETGLLFTFLEVALNTSTGLLTLTNNLLGMVAGAGIFAFITFIGGFIAGKEAMGFGDVKLMGALGLFTGWMNIIIISVLAFLFAAVISIAILIAKKGKFNDYIPFGPFIVVSSFITIFIPNTLLLNIVLRIITLGMYQG